MDGTAARPLYQTIRQDLESAILSGEWRPGHRVPSEHDLMLHYRCSRMTVNKALSLLASAGLVTRRRRSGSFVAAPAAEETVLELHDIPAEIGKSGAAYRYELIARKMKRASLSEAERLGIEAGDWLLSVTARHFAAERPHVLENRLINIASVPDARLESFAEIAPGSWLLARIPWNEAEHQIHAVNARTPVAKLLGIARGAACLVVERRTWYAGRTVTQVTLTYPGNAHFLTGRFSPARSRAAEQRVEPAKTVQSIEARSVSA